MTTFTARVTVNADDGYGQVGTFNNNGTSTALGHDGGLPNDSWYTFQNVTIPQGSNIVDAKVTFEASNTDSNNTVRTNIYCNDIDTAVSPANNPQLNALVRTTAFTAWDSLAGWTAGVTYDTPDIAPSVQEVVDRGSWASGNALMVIVDDDGSDASALRRAKSLEHAGTNVEALITVNWIPAFIPRTGGIF